MKSVKAFEFRSLHFIILSFCSVCAIAAETTVSMSDYVNGKRGLSPYEQFCCVETNKGKSTLTSDDEESIKIYMCPIETPASCSKFNLSPSCSGILTYNPIATSGYYNITPVASDGGNVVTEYCDMEGVDCDGKGGWMRVGYLNMSDPSEQCPPGFRLYEENGIRACGRQVMNAGGCQSVMFPTHDISYSKVCGRVTGYQIGSTSAIDAGHTDINGAYVDGVSITRGSPRHHIWTFMAGHEKNNMPGDLIYLCPCAPNSPLTTQSFIGNDYFCESGNPTLTVDAQKFYTEPIWDGKECGTVELSCCNVTGIPWFNKVLEQPTTDYIELRVCGDQDLVDEDAPVSYYEIYVK